MNDTTFQGDGKITYVPVVVNAKQPKQTNADKIRSMTDEELAKCLSVDGCCREGACSDVGCEQCWLGWLKQEVSE